MLAASSMGQSASVVAWSNSHTRPSAVLCHLRPPWSSFNDFMFLNKSKEGPSDPASKRGLI